MKKTWKVRSGLAFLCAVLLLVSSFNLCVPAAKAEEGNHLNVIFTIDVEDNGGNVPNLIEGDLSAYGIEENCGLDYIISTFQKYGVRAVFFVNVYEHILYDEDYMPSVLQRLQEAGMEIGLHTHEPGNGALPFYAKSLTGYEIEELKTILAYGRDYIYAATGVVPISYRSGSYAANDDLMQALYETGFLVDSSLYYGNVNNYFTQYKDFHNQVIRLNGLIEFPVVNVFNGKMWRKLDIESLGEEDVYRALEIIKDSSQFNTVQIMFHSKTFLDLEGTGNGEEPLLTDGNKKIYGSDNADKNELEQLLSFLTESADYDVITFQDYLSMGIEEPAYADDNLIILENPDIAMIATDDISITIEGEMLRLENLNPAENLEYAWVVQNKANNADQYYSGYAAENKTYTVTFQPDANGVFEIKMYTKMDDGNKASALFVHTVNVIDGIPNKIN